MEMKNNTNKFWIFIHILGQIVKLTLVAAIVILSSLYFNYQDNGTAIAIMLAAFIIYYGLWDLVNK